MIQTEDQITPVEDIIRIEAIELPEGLDLDEVTKKAISWNAAWQPVYEKKRAQWEENYRLFRHFDKGLVQNTSQRTYEIWANIQSEIPHLVNSIFTKSEVVKGLPKFRDTDGKSHKVNNFVNKMITVDNQGRRLASDAIQDFLVLGTAVSKSFWDNEEKLEFDMSLQQWVPKYEGKPSLYNVDPFNFAVDPEFNGHDINKAQWCRERIFFKKEDIVELAERGEVVQVSESVLTEAKPQDSGKEIRDKIDNVPPTKNTKVYVDEFWCTIYFKDATGKQRSGKFYFWLLNNTQIIKFKLNIFGSAPYKVTRCYRLAHEFWGLGDADVMASLAEHINVTHSQGALLAKKTGQKLTLITPAAGIDQQQLKNKENGVVTVKDLGQIKTENTTAGADLGTLINYKMSLKQDLNNAVGINDIMRGEQPGDMTATEASILNSNSSARLAMKLANFQDEWLVPVATSFYNLSKQFIDTYQFFVENQLIELKQEDFIGDYDWIPQGSTAMANRNLRIRQMTEIGQQLAQASQMAAASNGVVQFPPFDLGRFTQNEILSLLEVQDPQQYFAQAANTGQNLVASVEGGEQKIPAALPINENPLDQTSQLGIQEGIANSVVS